MLNIKNGPNNKSTDTKSIAFESEVFIYREKNKGTDSYKIIRINNNNVIVNTPNNPTKFKSTHIKPYERFQNLQKDVYKKAKA